MKITKSALIKLINEEFALATAENIPQNSPISPAKEPYFDYPDDEGRMAKRQLEQIRDYSEELIGMLTDNEQLESWVQSKITKAEDYISTVKHYLEYEMGRAVPDIHGSGPNPYDMGKDGHHIYEEDDEER
jgi:hypothetical protein